MLKGVKTIMNIRTKKNKTRIKFKRFIIRY